MKFHLTQLEIDLDHTQWTQILAIDEAGNAIGTVEIMHKSCQSASIRKLFVAKPVRKLSLGTRILERCAKLAKESGCFSIGLDISAGNLAVIPFYEKSGFKRTFEYQSGEVLLVKFL